MDISADQSRRYIQELQTLRNQRLDFLLSQGVQLEHLLADMMNELEVLYVIHRARQEQDPTEPFLGGVKSQEVQPKYVDDEISS